MDKRLDDLKTQWSKKNDTIPY